MSENNNEREADDASSRSVVPQNFRDALGCHVYMLYNIMCISEDEAKLNKQQSSMNPKSKGKKSKRSSENEAGSYDSTNSRKQCATAMLEVAEVMSTNKSTLWNCGVPDENVVSLPYRIACKMLESATNIMTRKSACADEALKMISASVTVADFSSMSTIVAALMDLLHSYEHIAILMAELCCLLSFENKVNRLAVQLLQEIGRSNYKVGRSTDTGASGDTAGKASGVKNVAPFISELAKLKPRIVLDNMIHILPLLNSEPYMLRNSVVYAIGHIVARFPQEEETSEEISESGDSTDESISESSHKSKNVNKTRDNLLDVLIERTHDRSSYTRCAVLKVWAQLSESNSIPLDRLMSVTDLAVDRLQDMSVNVRSKAMKVSLIALSNCSDINTQNLTLYSFLYEAANFIIREQSFLRVSRPCPIPR